MQVKGFFTLLVSASEAGPFLSSLLSNSSVAPVWEPRVWLQRGSLGFRALMRAPLLFPPTACPEHAGASGSSPASPCLTLALHLSGFRASVTLQASGSPPSGEGQEQMCLLPAPLQCSQPGQETGLRGHFLTLSVESKQLGEPNAMAEVDLVVRRECRLFSPAP